MSVHILAEYRKATIYRPLFLVSLDLLVDIFEYKTGKPAPEARAVLELARERSR